ncbi:MAG: 3'-5' exonuclease [Candidatus Hodarchaeales archaeon]
MPNSPFPENLRGFELWYKSLNRHQKVNSEIFLVDFKTQIFREVSEELEDQFYVQEDEDDQKVSSQYREISCVILYFLIYNSQKDQYSKHRAFIRQNPYFYLLLNEDVSPQHARTLAKQISNKYSSSIIKISPFQGYDANDLLFLKKNNFLKVEVNVPSVVPFLRDKLTDRKFYPGVKEWREADIQYHHRVAIDKNFRVGKWYNAKFQNQECIEIFEIDRKDTPPLNIVAYDIETDSDQSRQPNTDKDTITMIALYTGNDLSNQVIVNADKIDCTNVTDFFILIRESDKKHDLPWVDWFPQQQEDDLGTDSSVLKKLPMKVQIVPNEKHLIQSFLIYLQQQQPDIIADFYGDKFDFPFLFARAQNYGINLGEETGIRLVPKQDRNFVSDYMKDVESVQSHGVFHLDAWLWNLRYSYLPKKDLALKPSVTRKLKIIPIGRESLWQLKDAVTSKPAEAVGYAGSDGYITWRYVKEIILDFALSMGRMFPVNSSEILTKAAGSLDDLLVDSIGHHRGIVAKKRYKQLGKGYFNDKINIKGVTYTGGFVMAPNPGIWRSDLEYPIDVNTERLNDLKMVLSEILPKIEDKVLNNTRKTIFDTNIRQYFPSNDLYYNYQKASNDSNYISVVKNYLKNKKISANEGVILNEYEKVTQLIIINGDKKKKELFNGIENLIENKEDNYNLHGLHLDVTSMYPSQIRQYKLQPSSIVNPKYCFECDKRESGGLPNNPPCAFDSPWTTKINALKPCVSKVKDANTNNGFCNLKNNNCDFPYSEEENCPKFDMGLDKNISSQEFYIKTPEKAVEVYILDKGEFKEILFEKSFLSMGYQPDQQNSSYILNHFANWVETNIDGAKLNFDGNYPIRIEGLKDEAIEWKGFLYIDTRHKHTTLYVSLRSRFCQKAYDYMSSIMDMFFQERVNHKKEAKRLKEIINLKKQQNEKISANLIQQQKFHDSTQLGLKVPLNSIYGLLGMKGGVHNASLPSAGVTTSLSARLIQWSSKILGGFGTITELDTDGVWFFLPQSLPTKHKIEIGYDNIEPIKSIVTKNINLFEEYLNYKVKKTYSNPNHWLNDGKNITHSPKSLLSFEQDGPYDFQYVQGKKKYIVYNRTKDGHWKEEELIGLETKRSDFSKLHKELQEEIISTFLMDWETTASLQALFEKASQKVEEYVDRIRSGELNEEYFILPKTVKKALDEYSSRGPEVIAAGILQDLGYSVEPGSLVEYFLIKPIKDLKSGSELKVAPKLLFKQNYEDLVKFLKKRGIASLLFKLDAIKSMEDIREQVLRIDFDEYISSLIGDKKLADRMIFSVAQKQGINLLVPSLNGLSLNKHLNDTAKLMREKTNKVIKKKILRETSIQEDYNIKIKKKHNKLDLESVLQSDFIDFNDSNKLPNAQKPFLDTIKDEKNLQISNPVIRIQTQNKNQYLNDFLVIESLKGEDFLSTKSDVKVNNFSSTFKRFQKRKHRESYYCKICNHNWPSQDCLGGGLLCPFCLKELEYDL